jgi:hypothetical protein
LETWNKGRGCAWCIHIYPWILCLSRHTLLENVFQPHDDLVENCNIYYSQGSGESASCLLPPTNQDTDIHYLLPWPLEIY